MKVPFSHPNAVFNPTERPESTLRQDVEHESDNKSITFANASDLTLRQGLNSVVTSSRQPRRYHLSKSSFSSLSPVDVDGNGVRKRKKLGRCDVAVFEEKVRRAWEGGKGMDESPGIGHGRLPDGRTRVTTEDPKTSRKRPNATAEEKAWRQQTWKKPACIDMYHAVASIGRKNDSPDDFDPCSMELAMQLNQYALEESRTQNVKEVKKNMPTPKVKPKPPKPRGVKHPMLPSDPYTEKWSSSSSDLGEESNFIFDIYIRGALSSLDVEIHASPIDGIEDGKVGLLVIEDDEEAIWEAFGEDDDSDLECNSEEDDENGIVNPNPLEIKLADNMSSGGFLWKRLSGGRSRF